MAITVVGICNMALSHIGKNMITSLTDGSTEATKCNLFYEAVRDSVLQSSSWGFAEMNSALALLSNETVPGYDYLYQRPSKCLFMRSIFEAATPNPSTPNPYAIVLSPTSKQTAIACNIADAYAKYTYQVVDPNAFSPLFVETLSLKLAASMAQSLTGDVSLAQKITAFYNTALSEARRLNGDESVPPIGGTATSYLSAR